jgi:hypothetical protein
LEPAKFILKEGKNPKVINTVIAVEKSEWNFPMEQTFNWNNFQSWYDFWNEKSRTKFLLEWISNLIHFSSMEQICNVFGICKNEQISNRNKKFKLKVLRNGTNFPNRTNLLIFNGTNFYWNKISIGTNFYWNKFYWNKCNHKAFLIGIKSWNRFLLERISNLIRFRVWNKLCNAFGTNVWI